MAGNDCKWLKMEWLEITRHVGNGNKLLEWLDMAGHGWKWLKMRWHYYSFGDLGLTGYEDLEFGDLGISNWVRHNQVSLSTFFKN